VAATSFQSRVDPVESGSKFPGGYPLHFQPFHTSTAVAVILLFAPVVAGAAETHTIVPVYPDAFTLQLNSVQDDVKDQFGKIEGSRTEMAFSAEMTRKGDGYQGVYRVDKFELQIVGPDGKIQSTPAVTQMVSDMVKSAGVARVTLNNALEPVSVDNIEEIKTSVKTFMASTTKKGSAEKVAYNAVIAGLTPETAAQWIRSTNRSGVFYNVAMTLGQPVETISAPVELMGTPIRNRTVLTLQSWEEGKAARLQSVSQPLDEDANKLIANLARNMAAQSPQAETDEDRAKMERVFDSITVRIKETCDTEVDLANPGNYRSVCDSVTTMTIDLAKLVGPDEPLPEGVPPTIATTETSHKVNDTRVVR
jgi:hypothetical protein